MYSKKIKMNIQELNRMFDLGVLPPEFDFNNQKQETEEELLTRLKFNAFYKTFDFVLQRFPDSDGLLNLPGGEKIVQAMIDNFTSPHEEMLERQSRKKYAPILQDEELKQEQINGLDESLSPQGGNRQETGFLQCAQNLLQNTPRTDNSDEWLRV